MVSIGKISTNPIYYVSQVAPGPEAYYSGSGEKPSTWVGRGCEGLNLSGEVAEDALGAVLGGKDPATGDSLVTGKAASVGRLGGYDLTFSAPKGVSLLACLSRQLAAAFRHRTSRSEDPQLRTHVVVANLVHGDDGRWSAIWGKPIYAQARTAGLAPGIQIWTRRLHPSPTQLPTRR